MKKYLSLLYLPIAVQVIFTILYSITVALFPVLNKTLFDNFANKDIGFIIYLMLLYLGLIILNAIFQYFARLYEWKVSKEFNLSIKKDLFYSIASLKNDEFKKKTSVEYLAVFNNNINVIYDDYISATIDLIKSSLNIIIFSGALLVFVDWRITIVVIVTSLITSLLPKIIQKSLSSKRKVQLDSLRNYFKVVSDLISGKKRIDKHSIRFFNNEHDQHLKSSEKARYKFGKIKTLADLINALGIYFIQLSTFITVAILLYNEQITIGIGIAAFGYVTSFIRPIQNILECVNCIHSTKETIEETLGYIHDDLLKPEDHHYNDIIIKKLELNKVSYKVDRFKLYPFSYKFVNGKSYAITGHSGSGKSTLLKIIDGNIRPDNGSITVDNKELDKNAIDDYIFSLDQFEHLFQIGFVENITTFNSISNNITYADKLISKLSYETKNKITKYESVDQLSGGEKQIIGILRMLIANRPIILMDESYANIDKSNTTIIKNFIKSLHNKILIEVTHDISDENLNSFDEVLMLDEGKLF